MLHGCLKKGLRRKILGYKISRSKDTKMNSHNFTGFIIQHRENNDGKSYIQGSSNKGLEY